MEPSIFWCISDHTSFVEDLKNIATIKGKKGNISFVNEIFSQGSNNLSWLISPTCFGCS